MGILSNIVKKGVLDAIKENKGFEDFIENLFTMGKANAKDMLGVEIERLDTNYIVDCKIKEFETDKIGLRIEKSDSSCRMYFVFDNTIPELIKSMENISSLLPIEYKHNITVKTQQRCFRIFGLFPVLKNKEHFHCSFDRIIDV